MENQAEMQQKPKQTVNCDQECWVKDRLRDTIRMAIALRENKGVRANEHGYNMAINGLIEGQAIEIIKTLGLEPEYTNLRPEQQFFTPLGHTNNSVLQPANLKITE